MVAIIGGTVVEIPGMIIAAILKRIFARYWVGFSRDTEVDYRVDIWKDYRGDIREDYSNDTGDFIYKVNFIKFYFID